MTAKDLGFFKTILISQRAEILNRSLKKFSDMPAEGAHGDEADVATTELTNAVILSLQGREHTLLQKIDTALAKIDTGRFGYCANCEEPMGEQRLAARPMAELCIACQEDREAQR